MDFHVVDFATPFVVPGSEPAAASGAQVDPEAIMMIVSMGFTEPQAKKALKATVRCDSYH